MNTSEKSHQPNPDDVQAADGRKRISARLVYLIVLREGIQELERPVASLAWSGVAAGPAVSMSLLAQAILHHHLEGSDYRMALESLGYTVGFLIVILGRIQLFTENTITAVLPLFANLSWRTLARTARLWAVVFCANIVGTFFSVFAARYFNTIPDPILDAMLEVSRRFASKTPLEAFTHAIPAGFLIAVVVWMLPSSGSSQFSVVVALTYWIGLGDFAHVIVGSTEVFLLLLTNHLDLTTAALGLILPALLGNIVGGTALFAAMAYAQVRREM